MRRIFDNKGVALVMVLSLIAISTAMIMLVLHFVQRGTDVSMLEKKYETAKEASYGAVEAFTKEIIPLAIVAGCASSNTSLTTALGNFNSITSATITAVATNACFSDKLMKSTTNWASGCSSGSDPKTFPDIKFTLSGNSPAVPFDVYTKIVDTIKGNTDTGGIALEGMGAAESSAGLIYPQHFPYMYTIEVQGERKNNPSERANLEALYAY
jgi:hypothetical protein